MTLGRLPYLTAGALLALSGAILIWPLPGPTNQGAPPPPTYRGAEHQALQVSVARDAPFRLTVNGETAPPAVSNAPTLVGLSGGQRAYLRSASTGEVVALRQGDALDGWTLVAIDARSATIRSSQNTRRLTLFAMDPAR